MTPYYEEDGITIYHGDCLQVMGEMAPYWGEQLFDVLLTDPPYGVLQNGSAATRLSGGNQGNGSQAWDVQQPEALACAMALTRSHMVWGGLHLGLPKTFGYLVWDKQIDGLNFGECEVCWTSMRFAPRIFRYRAVRVDGGKVHPTQKPEALLSWCLAFTDAATVFGPFVGSGSTLVAAKRLGKQGTGIEREEKYCEIAAKRLAQRALPLEIAR